MVPFKPPSLTDNLKGMWRSIIGGTALQPGKTFKHIRNAQAERLRNDAFGMGYPDGSGGSENYAKPVHAATRDGKPVTVSFGRGPMEGHTLIVDGHMSDMSKFYDIARDGLKGHDHYLPDGGHAGGIDRGRHSD